MRPDSSFVAQPIRSLQTMLRTISKDDLRYPSIIPDGIYGPDTMNAVAAFQRLEGLPVTGITNQPTWDAIVDKYAPARIRQEKAEAIEILLEPGQVINPGETSPYIYITQAMLAYIANTDNVMQAPTLTGELDKETELALTLFQEYAALPANGALDRNTWRHLVQYFTLNTHISERKQH